MRLTILIGGKAGQGINTVSQIVARILIGQGYFIFNYRDYPSIIRGGHNYNVLSISDKKIASHESKLDGIIALDKNTIEKHKTSLKPEGFMITFEDFKIRGQNLNVTLAGAFAKKLGISEKLLVGEVKKGLAETKSVGVAIAAAKQGYESQKEQFKLKKLNNKIKLMSGSQAICQGAIESKIDLYIAYPMTPATNALHELAAKQKKAGHKTFQAENEIAVASMALGASFTGANVMVGTSGGGFDLMTETLSMQAIAEIPLVVYLASRVGPGTGVPTYTLQGDLNLALHGGHGEFARLVVAPGDINETIELTNQAIYLAHKFNSLSIILSDKHVAESEFSVNTHSKKALKIKSNLPELKKGVFKATSYESTPDGLSTEDAKLTKINSEKRLAKFKLLADESKKFEMIKLHGNLKSKNLIVGWGSTKGAILDAIEGLNYKFLQILYMEPFSEQVKEELEKAKKIILVENNLTGQLKRLIREKTGILIEKKILKYDGRPFLSDELRRALEVEVGK